MKRIFTLCLIASLLLFSLASCGGGDDGGESLASEGLAYSVSTENPGECIITGIGTCTDTHVVIPSYIDNLRVVGIADGAFSPKRPVRETAALTRRATLSLLSATPPLYEYTPVFGGAGTGEPNVLSEIESIEIPASVSSIGEEAFYGCEALADIETHTALSEIGKDAFKETAYYNDPENWDGEALYLSNYLITVMNSASGEFTVRDGTTMIAAGAFYQCEYVTSVNFAASVTAVGEYAFYGCTSLTYTNYQMLPSLQFAGNAFEGSTYYYAPIYQGPQGGTQQGPTYYPGSGTANLYSEISEAVFEAAKVSLPTRYTYRAILTEEYSGSLTVIKTDGVNSYYTHSVDGETERELYLYEGEAYAWISDALYSTTATLPAPIGIPEELSYLDLVCTRDSKGAIYSYEIPEGKMRLGFLGERLAYLQFDTPLYTLKIQYGDFESTEVPAPKLEHLVPGVSVDENGSIVQ